MNKLKTILMKNALAAQPEESHVHVMVRMIEEATGVTEALFIKRNSDGESMLRIAAIIYIPTLSVGELAGFYTLIAESPGDAARIIVESALGED